MARIGVLPLARPTFDVPFAEEMAARAFAALDASGHDIIGGRALLFDAQATGAALEALTDEALDLVLILQVTFTDATMTVKIAESVTAPVGIWAFPEPRLGGRLRLNGFCGLNLAAHALGRADKPFTWVYGVPEMPDLAGALGGMIAGQLRSAAAAPESVVAGGDAAAGEAAQRVLARLSGARIGLIGRHPDGFDTCRYDPKALHDLTGLSVEPIALEALWDGAKTVDGETVARTRSDVANALAGIDDVNQAELDRSLRVFSSLEELTVDKGLSGLAVRCWPEMFTEYGCAACGPMAMMNERQVPSSCEADVYGTLSTLTLQTLADEPALLVDMVDLDPAENTGVIWHCGLAPLSMADPDSTPEAAIHSNRRMPLLHQFPLKPGRVTVARFSQAKNTPMLMLAGAEMLRAPMSFTGTSGVLKFDRPAGDVMSTIMGACLEHHYAIVYGDHRPALRALAGAMSLPVLELA